MITLTVREIKDLAELAGLVLNSTFPPDDDQLETETSITTEPAECSDDDGKVERYAHLASMAEYPEEGCMPLGEPLPPNTRNQPAEPR